MFRLILIIYRAYLTARYDRSCMNPFPGPISIRVSPWTAFWISFNISRDFSSERILENIKYFKKRKGLV